jgi:predicted NBD/HSP70 family sugar kinase
MIHINTYIEGEDSIRAINRARVLRLIFEKGALPRNQIAQMIGLTQASVSRIVSECIDVGIIIQEEELSTDMSGRRPIPISLNPKQFYVVGVHIGPLWIDIGLLNLRAEVLNHSRYSREQKSPESTILSIKEHILAIKQKYSGHIIALGVTLNGQVDPVTGDVLDQNVLGWEKTPLRKWFENELKILTIVDNNVYALAATEFVKNPLPPNNLLLSVNIGMSIGIGMVVNHSVIRGKQGLTGLVEHVPWKSEGPLCECGLKGCLTYMLTDRSLLKKARDIIEYAPLGDINALIDASKYNNQLEDLLRERAERVGEFLAFISILHDPARLVLSGSCLIDTNNLNWVKQSYNRHLNTYQKHYVEIETPDLTKTVPLTFITAAGNLALQSFFTSAFNLVVHD